MRVSSRPKTASIHTSWVRMFRKRGWQSMFWIAVAHRVADRNVRSTDLTQVKLICKEVDYEFTKREEKSRSSSQDKAS